MVRRFSELETQAYIEKNLQITISIREVSRLKRSIREEAHKWIGELTKDQDLYVDQYRQRINELLSYQRELWKCYYNEQATIGEKIKAQEALAKITWMITSLYDVLPVMSAVRPLENRNAVTLSLSESAPAIQLPAPAKDTTESEAAF